MSWQINGTGKYYHDYSEYLRAKEEAENTGVAARQRERAEQLVQEMRELEQQAIAAEGNTLLQREAAEGLRQRMSELASLGDRINASILAEQSRMDQEFEGFAETATNGAQEQEKLRQDFGRWREEWQGRQTVARVQMERMMQDQRESLQEVEIEMAARREQQQQRLDADRAARLAQEKDALQQTTILAEEVKLLADQQAEQAEVIGAKEFVIRANSMRSAAQAAVKHAQTAGGDAGLMAISGTWMEVTQLREEVESAAARLSTARKRAQQFVQDIRDICSTELVQSYFAREVADLNLRLAGIIKESERVFTDWGAFCSRWPAWEQQLMRASDQASEWASRAPELDGKAAWRQEKLVESINVLLETAGALAEDPAVRLVDENDNKSVAICDLVFVSGEKIRLSLDIQSVEGPMVKVDSWGHHDNTSCAASYQRINAIIQGISSPFAAQQNHSVHGHGPQPSLPKPVRIPGARAPGNTSTPVT